MCIISKCTGNGQVCCEVALLIPWHKFFPDFECMLESHTKTVHIYNQIDAINQVKEGNLRPRRFFFITSLLLLLLVNSD